MHLSLKEQLELSLDGAIFENVFVQLVVFASAVWFLNKMWKFVILRNYSYSLGEGSYRRYVQLFSVLLCYFLFFLFLHKQNDILANYIVPFSNWAKNLGVVNYEKKCRDYFGMELPNLNPDDKALCATINACDEIAKNVNSEIASSVEYKRALFDCYYSDSKPNGGGIIQKIYSDWFEREKNIRVSEARGNQAETIDFFKNYSDTLTEMARLHYTAFRSIINANCKQDYFTDRPTQECSQYSEVSECSTQCPIVKKILQQLMGPFEIGNPNESAMDDEQRCLSARRIDVPYGKFLNLGTQLGSEGAFIKECKDACYYTEALSLSFCDDICSSIYEKTKTDISQFSEVILRKTDYSEKFHKPISTLCAPVSETAYAATVTGFQRYTLGLYAKHERSKSNEISGDKPKKQILNTAEFILKQYDTQKDEIKDRLEQEVSLQIIKFGSLAFCFFVCIMYVVRHRSGDTGLNVETAASGFFQMKNSRIAATVFWLLVLLNLVIDIRLSYNAELQTEIGNWVRSIEKTFPHQNLGWETFLRSSGLFQRSFMKVGPTILTHIICVLTIALFVYQQGNVSIRGGINNNTNVINAVFFATTISLAVFVNKDFHWLTAVPLLSLGVLGTLILRHNPGAPTCKAYYNSEHKLGGNDRSLINYAFPCLKLGSLVEKKSRIYLEFSEDILRRDYIHRKKNNSDGSQQSEFTYSYLYIETHGGEFTVEKCFRTWFNPFIRFDWLRRRSLSFEIPVSDKLPQKIIKRNIKTLTKRENTGEKKQQNQKNIVWKVFLRVWKNCVQQVTFCELRRKYPSALFELPFTGREEQVIPVLRSNEVLREVRASEKNKASQYYLRNLSREQEVPQSGPWAVKDKVEAHNIFYFLVKDKLIPNDFWNVVVIDATKQHKNPDRTKDDKPIKKSVTKEDTQNEKKPPASRMVFFCYKTRENETKNRLRLK